MWAQWWPTAAYCPSTGMPDADSLARPEGETVGKSFTSYCRAWHQWALPIDAAT